MEANTAAILAEQCAAHQVGPHTQRPRERRFDLRSVSVGHARSFVIDGLSGRLSNDRIDDVKVCVSELATNAIRYSSRSHPGDCFLVHVARCAQRLRVEVRDGGGVGGVAPHVRWPADDDSAGRGLFLVAALADDWGVRRNAGSGYTVWIEFRTTPPTGCETGREVTAITPHTPTEPQKGSTMFDHAERIPTGTAIPTGLPTPPPWGLGRLVPYPSARTSQHTRAEIDAESQTARYFDAGGVPVAAPGHGTSSGTNPSTGTSPDGHGGGDTDTGNDTDQ